MKVNQIETKELKKKDMKLEDQANGDMSPVVVDVYQDAKSGVVYQLDRKNNRYRQAQDGGAYGAWSACS